MTKDERQMLRELAVQSIRVVAWYAHDKIEQFGSFGATAAEEALATATGSHTPTPHSECEVGSGFLSAKYDSLSGYFIALFREHKALNKKSDQAKDVAATSGEK